MVRAHRHPRPRGWRGRGCGRRRRRPGKPRFPAARDQAMCGSIAVIATPSAADAGRSSTDYGSFRSLTIAKRQFNQPVVERRNCWWSHPALDVGDRCRMSPEKGGRSNDGELVSEQLGGGTPSMRQRRRTCGDAPAPRRHGSRRRSPCSRRPRVRRDRHRAQDRPARDASASSRASTERTITTPGTADRKQLPSIRSRVTTTWSAMIGLPSTAEMHVHVPRAGSWRASTSEKAAGPS